MCLACTCAVSKLLYITSPSKYLKITR
jgi:hypothetical protein